MVQLGSCTARNTVAAGRGDSCSAQLRTTLARAPPAAAAAGAPCLPACLPACAPAYPPACPHARMHAGASTHATGIPTHPHVRDQDLAGKPHQRGAAGRIRGPTRCMLHTPWGPLPFGCTACSHAPMHPPAPPAPPSQPRSRLPSAAASRSACTAPCGSGGRGRTLRPGRRCRRRPWRCCCRSHTCRATPAAAQGGAPARGRTEGGGGGNTACRPWCGVHRGGGDCASIIARVPHQRAGTGPYD